MEANGSSPKNLPQDIQTALQEHHAVLRLSYIEIVSGINRLLRQGIPKEVISQVVAQAVKAVSKDFNPLSYQDFYSRTKTQPDAFTTDEASLREPSHATWPPAQAAVAVEERVLAPEKGSDAAVPECGERSVSAEDRNVSVCLKDLMPAIEGKHSERAPGLGSRVSPPDSAAQLIAEMKRNLAAVSPVHLMPPRGGNELSSAAKGNQRSAVTLETMNRLPRNSRRTPIYPAQVLQRLIFKFKCDWISMINAIALPEMKKPFLRWLRRPISSNLWRQARTSPFEARRDLHR
jgi:hypothetical protein